MPSKAYTNLEERLKEIDQLVDAHTALTKFQRAEKQAKSAGSGLQSALKLITTLVSDSAGGRPSQVHALNSSAIALLSAHFQGYVAELFDEAVEHLLKGRVVDVECVKSSAPRRGNPNAENISKLFETVGFPAVMDAITWKNMSNDRMKSKLKQLNILRTKLVHGSRERVVKAKVTAYTTFVRSLVAELDHAVGSQIASVTRKQPW